MTADGGAPGAPRPGLRNAAAMACLAAGFPLFAWQAYRLWRDTLRLPEAPGPRSGTVPGHEPVLNLAVTGESPAAGVGAPDHDTALGGSVARALGARTGRAVRWQVLAGNGATAGDVLREYVPRLGATRADCVVVALGANDILSLRTPGRWERDLGRVLDAIHARLPRAVVVVSAVPPVGHFPQIARPLRDVLGWRAQDFDRASQRAAAARERVLAHVLPFEGGAEYFCEDGFHPSPLGHRRWAESLADLAAPRLRSGPS